MEQSLFNKASEIQSKINYLEGRISGIEQMIESGYDARITSVNDVFIPIYLSETERKEIGEILLEATRASLEAYKQMFNNL